MIAPSPLGVNPYPSDPLYTADPPGSLGPTYPMDQTYLTIIQATIPPANANGMYVVDNIDNRRGPYYNTPATHIAPYSPFHPDAKLCGTCHDVSNPVYQTVYDGDGNIMSDDTLELSLSFLYLFPKLWKALDKPLTSEEIAALDIAELLSQRRKSRPRVRPRRTKQ